MRREGNTVIYSAEELDEMLARGESETDWERVKAMTEEELLEAIRSDPDEGPESLEPGYWRPLTPERKAELDAFLAPLRKPKSKRRNDRPPPARSDAAE